MTDRTADASSGCVPPELESGHYLLVYLPRASCQVDLVDRRTECLSLAQTRAPPSRTSNRIEVLLATEPDIYSRASREIAVSYGLPHNARKDYIDRLNRPRSKLGGLLPEDVPVTCRGPAARSPGSGSRGTTARRWHVLNRRPGLTENDPLTTLL
jgi:hypothetical protein